MRPPPLLPTREAVPSLGTPLLGRERLGVGDAKAVDPPCTGVPRCTGAGCPPAPPKPSGDEVNTPRLPGVPGVPRPPTCWGVKPVLPIMGGGLWWLASAAPFPGGRIFSETSALGVGAPICGRIKLPPPAEANLLRLPGPANPPGPPVTDASP